MEVKMAATSSLQRCSQPYSVPQSPSSSQALVSAIPSPASASSSSKRRSFSSSCHCNRSTLFGAHLSSSSSSSFYKSRSYVDLQWSRVRETTIGRAFSTSLGFFPDEESSKEIQELELSNTDEDGSNQSSKFEGQKNSKDEYLFETRFEEHGCVSSGELKFFDAPDFHVRDDSIERKANSFDIPLSLRIIQRKKQGEDGVIQVGESPYCSMKKAFSSMVYIIRELHSYSLQMRGVLFYEDLQGILSSVQKEIHASFVWLFQKIFSQTPTLMVYLMILLANYSVYSISNNTAIALTVPPLAQVSTTTTTTVEDDDQIHFVKHNLDSLVVQTYKLTLSSGKNTASVGGDGCGGGNCKPIASGTDGDGRFNDESKNHYKNIITPDSTVSRQVSQEEEMTKLRVDEASEIQSEQPLDRDTMHRFVSPVDAKNKADDHLEYVKMESVYQTGLAQEPENPLLLANYAQFLYLFAQDYDRAEEHFKRAIKIEPKDAEALNKYANFLWLVRKDLWAAEETYLEAIDVEPENSYYAANYAHFLWNTGGEDTCFPLSTD